MSPTNCDFLLPRTGDADCDYGLDLDDVIDVLRDQSGVEEVSCPQQANAKCDDDLSPLDALLTLEYIAGAPPLYLPPWCQPYDFWYGPLAS